MDKIINASIAGISFRLDTNAYAKLDKYLGEINSYYGKIQDGAEIISDIEARIAEIILSKQDSSQVVNAETIDSIISQLGMPEDMEYGEPAKPAAEKEDREQSVPPKNTESFSRRLYRNPMGSNLAGVCNGLATYFNVDVSLVRLIFMSPLIFTVICGIMSATDWSFFEWATKTAAMFIPIFVFIYIIMWIIIPKAKTPRQVLEMRGEKITSSRIEQVFREDFSDMESNIKNKPSQRSEKNASIFAQIITLFGNIVLFCLKAFLFLAALVMVAGILAIAFTGIKFFSSAGILSSGGISNVTLYSIVILLFILVLIPVIAGVLALLRVTFSFKGSKTLNVILSIIWLVALIVFIFFSIFSFRANDGRQLAIPITPPAMIGSELTDVPEKNNLFFNTRVGLSTSGESSALQLLSDTIYLVPFDTARHKGFNNVEINVIKSHRENAPRIKINRKYRGMLWEVANGGTVDVYNVGYKVVNDTIYVHDKYRRRRGNESAEIVLTVPDRITVMYDEKISRYREYRE